MIDVESRIIGEVKEDCKDLSTLEIAGRIRTYKILIDETKKNIKGFIPDFTQINKGSQIINSKQNAIIEYQYKIKVYADVYRERVSTGKPGCGSYGE